MAEPNNTDSKSNILETILSIIQDNPPPEGIPSDIVEDFYRILDKHQYRVDRTRPRKQISRLLEDLFKGD
jgi:hypothetical protein